MRLTDDMLRADRNNFNLVRLVLATAVIFSHSFEMMRGADPTRALLGVPVSGLAVDGFFALSGFLVTGSILRTRSPRKFVAARVRRILPGLFVMLALSVFIMGPLLTTRVYEEYFSSSETWSYLIINASMLLTRYSLPGVFADLPLSGVVNGSLWTIRFEFYCYLGLAMVFGSGLLNEKRMKWLLPSAFVIALLVWMIPPRDGFLGALLTQGPRLSLTFLCGSAAYLFRDRIRLSWGILVAMFACYVVVEMVSDARLIRPVMMTCFVLSMGLLTARKEAIFAHIPDYSYGMYIYAFPVQQLLITALGMMNPYLHMALSVVVTVPFAAASWHLVEKPVLDRSRSRSLKTATRLS